MNLNLENLAPISIQVYTRFDHFKKCIESLASNDLAKHSVLYIFSDAAKPGDEKAVSKIRDYAKLIKGFKKVNLFFQKDNNQIKNQQDSLELPYEASNKIIIMEDDIIVQKSFLRFMNIALNIYEKEDDIFCVSGYVGPENHLKKSNDAQAYHIPDGAGLGFWKEKYFAYLNDHKSCHPWLRFKKNFFYLVKFCSNFGFSMLMFYKKMYDNNLYFGDQLYLEYVYRKKKLVLIPPFSLTLNKGYDGSGLNCGFSDEFNNEKFLRQIENFNFPNKFNAKQAYQKTQKTLKFRDLKPNFVRQVYGVIAYFHLPPKIIRDFFKKIGF